MWYQLGKGKVHNIKRMWRRSVFGHVLGASCGQMMRKKDVVVIEDKYVDLDGSDVCKTCARILRKKGQKDGWM